MYHKVFALSDDCGGGNGTEQGERGDGQSAVQMGQAVRMSQGRGLPLPLLPDSGIQSLRTRIFPIANAIFLALLLFSASVSREAIHQFAGHEDTVHTGHDEDGPVIEKQHRHCDFLDDVLMPFVQADLLVLPAAPVPVYPPAQASRVLTQLRAGIRGSHDIRGPPAA